MPINVKEVCSRGEMRDFVKFANVLYKDCPYYCPTIDGDEYNTFDPRSNPSLGFCDYGLFLAYDTKGEVVGRVASYINRIANEYWHCQKVRFGWIDFIDSQDVCNSLLDAVAQWGKERGMTHMNGPVGFTDFDREGALVEGYEYLSPMVSLYNYPYYIPRYESYGLMKEADWIEFQIYPPEKLPERWMRLNEVVMRRSNLHLVKFHNSRELFKRYPHMEYLDVLDLAYRHLYNYQPMTQEQKAYYAKYFIRILNFDFVSVVENSRDECIGVAIGMPDISLALRRCKGKVFPFGWYHLLKAVYTKQIDTCDLLLIGIHPDYQNKGITSLLFGDFFSTIKKYGVKKLETTSILETNLKNQANFLDFDHIQHKRRRAYIKRI